MASKTKYQDEKELCSFVSYLYRRESIKKQRFKNEKHIIESALGELKSYKAVPRKDYMVSGRKEKGNQEYDFDYLYNSAPKHMKLREEEIQIPRKRTLSFIDYIIRTNQREEGEKLFRQKFLELEDPDLGAYYICRSCRTFLLRRDLSHHIHNSICLNGSEKAAKEKLLSFVSYR